MKPSTTLRGTVPQKIRWDKRIYGREMNGTYRCKDTGDVLHIILVTAVLAGNGSKYGCIVLDESSTLS